MNFILRHLKQTCTIWELSDTTDAYGNPTFLAPRTLKVRWEGRTIRTIDSDGVDIISQAFVFMDRRYDVGSYLYLGTDTSTTPPSGAHSIKNFASVPNLRNSFSEHKATL